MLAYIKGTVASVGETSVIVECNNIGYELVASSRCLSGLNVGDEVKLQTFLAVREDSVTLYGFADSFEKDTFCKLTGVSGVGPKGALAILSAIDAHSLAACVVNQDVSSLCSAKGIGKKTAERIVLELKGKMNVDNTFVSQSVNTANFPAVDDAVSALVSLGYGVSEALSALSRVEGKERMTTEEIIMAALRG